MNSLLDEIDPEEPRSNTDVTLGVGSLLSIFFGVVLICGIFFGFGYSMGRRNAHSATSTASATKPPAATETIPSRELNSEPVKPQDSDSAAGAPDAVAPADHAKAPDGNAKASGTKETPAASATDRGAHDETAQDSAKPGRSTRVVESNSNDTALTAVPYAHRPSLPSKPHAGIPAPLTAVDAEPTPGHPVMVQIAAVSRQEDAEVLAGALRKRGFSPSVRPGMTDKFFHVQVGPFTNKAEAETMKQHLLSDGYNAILK